MTTTVIQTLRATAWSQAFNFWQQTRGIEAATPADLVAASRYATKMAAQAVQEWKRVTAREWADAERDAKAVWGKVTISPRTSEKLQAEIDALVEGCKDDPVLKARVDYALETGKTSHEKCLAEGLCGPGLVSEQYRALVLAGLL